MLYTVHYKINLLLTQRLIKVFGMLKLDLPESRKKPFLLDRLELAN